MKKYIDADKLQSQIREWYNAYKLGAHSPFRNGKVEALKETIELVDSLQQEQSEMDLEKEIEEHAIYMPHGEFASDNEILEDMEWARKEFRYFYERGFNARR